MTVYNELNKQHTIILAFYHTWPLMFSGNESVVPEPREAVPFVMVAEQKDFAPPLLENCGVSSENLDLNGCPLLDSLRGVKEMNYSGKVHP